MKYRMLGVDGDYVLGDRGNMHYTGAAAVGQAIKTRLKLLLGEWWENTEDGLPLFEQILGQFGGEENLNGVDLIVQDRIRATENVLEIKEFNRTFVNGKYIITAVVTTVFGDIEVNTEGVI